MSIFKTAIVLSLAVALMPSDKGQQQRLYLQAATAAQWASTYCDRNPDDCVKAAGYWETFKGKAQFAGQLAFDAAQRYVLEANQRDNAADEQPAAFVPAAQGTLTPHDLKPAWRGSNRRQGI